MKAITTKYRGPTNAKGSRITASDEDGNRVTIPYPYTLSGEDCHREAADALKAKMRWTGRLIGGSVRGGYVFVFAKEDTAILRALKELLELAEGEYPEDQWAEFYLQILEARAAIAKATEEKD